MSAAKYIKTLVMIAAMSLLTASACGSCDDDAGTGRHGGLDGGGGDAQLLDGGVDPDSEDGGDTGDDTTQKTDAGQDVDGGDSGAGCAGAQLCDGVCCGPNQSCVQGQCMDPCDNRCGKSLQLCCSDAEVCIFDGCHEPGAACSSSFECPDTEYCETTLGNCLPRDAADKSCTWRPPIGEFTPSSEGHFTGIELNGSTFDKSITTPTVADIDNDGLPEIAVLLYRGSLKEALIAVINGEDMSVLAYGGVGQVRTNSAGLAIADLDPTTPELEIVALQDGGGLVAFKYNPANQTLDKWWSNDTGPLGNIDDEAAPTIADIDGDGSPEVALGFSVVDAAGAIWNGINKGPAGGQGGYRSIVALVDMDGAVDADGNTALELVAGNRVLKSDGSLLWDMSDTVSDGYPAVADFGGDGVPEVVNVSDDQVYVLSGADGSVVFGPYDIPGNSDGGPPTVADFDGDDKLEFAAAGRGKYSVYDLDCTGNNPDTSVCSSGRDDGVLWSAAVQDYSSSRTGSSVFDFEGDGKAEVVYNDECFLRVFDGRDGTVLYEQANSTRTGAENPIVVDVDADFNAEIVVVSNNDKIGRDDCAAAYPNYDYPTGGTAGVFVYGDANNNWVPTRSIWNQHAYHITNILPHGEVPADEPVHYKSTITNSFRLNAQPDGLFNAPDLVVDGIELLNGACGSEVTVEVAVTIKNDGTQGVGSGTPVEVKAVHNGATTTLGTVASTTRLLPGQTETVTVEWTVPQAFIDDGFDVSAAVDPASSVNECVEDNNNATFTPEDGDLAFGALAVQAIEVDDASCGASSRIGVTVTVQNQGNATIPANVPVVVEADRGSSVETIDTVTTSGPLTAGDTEQFHLNWGLPGSFYGLQFKVRATIDPDGDVHPCSSGVSGQVDASCVPSG